MATTEEELAATRFSIGHQHLFAVADEIEKGTEPGFDLGNRRFCHMTRMVMTIGAGKSFWITRPLSALSQPVVV